LENALTLVQSGFANSDDAPGLKHAAPLLVAEPSNQDSGSFSELEKGLGGIGQGIIETLLGVQAKDIQQRIHLPEASPKKE